MNELEELRAQLLGIRAQADAALRAVNALIEATQEPEPETPKPRTFGGGKHKEA